VSLHSASGTEQRAKVTEQLCIKSITTSRQQRKWKS